MKVQCIRIRVDIASILFHIENKSYSLGNIWNTRVKDVINL